MTPLAQNYWSSKVAMGPVWTVPSSTTSPGFEGDVVGFLYETVLAKFMHEDPKYNNEGITGTIPYDVERGKKFPEKTQIGFVAFRNMKLKPYRIELHIIYRFTHQ